MYEHCSSQSTPCVCTTLNSIFNGTPEEIKRPKRTLKSPQRLTTITTQCKSISHLSVYESMSSHFPISLADPQHYLFVFCPVHILFDSHKSRLHVFSKHTTFPGAGLTKHSALYLSFATFCFLLYIWF